VYSYAEYGGIRQGEALEAVLGETTPELQAPCVSVKARKHGLSLVALLLHASAIDGGGAHAEL
jgi:hypothetical protein